MNDIQENAMVKRGTYLRLAAVAATAMIAEPAMAADIGTMATNFKESIPGMAMLVGKAVPIFGVGLIISALLASTRVETGKATAKQVMWTLFVGSAMIALGSSIGSIGATAGFADSKNNILTGQFKDVAGGGAQCSAVGGVLMWIQFIGLVGFGRGLLLWHKFGSGREEDGLWRGLTHLLGGSAAMNITTTAMIFANTFGTKEILKVLCL